MGIQVSFYMTPLDESRFLEEIKKFGNYSIARNTFRNPKEMLVEHSSALDWKLDEQMWYLFSTEFDSQIYTKFIETISTYTVDFVESEVIQFARSHKSQDWLSNGRLWYSKVRLSGEKNPQFLSWANRIINFIRRNYQKKSTGIYYVGPDALMKSNEGHLQLGPSFEPSWDEIRKKLESGQ
ncbi:hypothetical protein [Gloeobacter morelensis]|uniref:Uncharacterized protein n=1 Tax=Gloeobacter morelensis MG652769 TaxID=2781736 RepID=A0ABY3PKX8_9CYAN|nr:hypothetical protein [Gloeobacter morelensis]UFP94203.1 hypothetical protein ISF26_20975 [Gloeobacter morelensis MG652769]